MLNVLKILNIHKLGGILPPNSIYVGNKNTQYNLEKSKFANPYYIDQDKSRAKKIELFEQHLLNQLETGQITKANLLELYGKDLVCFCFPKPCHADIIRKYVIKAYFDPQFLT